MDAVDETPVTKPGCPKARAGSSECSAVPEHVEYDNTNKMSTALHEAVKGDGEDMSPDNFIEQLAGKLIEMGGGGGDGNGGAEAHAKAAKKQNSLVILLMLLVGPGGAVAAHYALKSQAESTAYEVQNLKKLEPRVKQTEDDIRFIKVRVGKIDTSVESLKTGQNDIAEGIQELKKENVTRLKDELEETKRELRRAQR